jgi:hypothetical protein
MFAAMTRVAEGLEVVWIVSAFLLDGLDVVHLQQPAASGLSPARPTTKSVTFEDFEAKLDVLASMSGQLLEALKDVLT